MSRSRLYHAFYPLWACACRSLRPPACVVAFIPLVACLGVTTCETHLHDVGVLDTHLSLLRAMMLCLPCLLYATRLAFFVSLYFCTLAYMFVHESLCLLVSWSLILTISCRFRPVFDTWGPKSLLGILLDGTCIVCTPIQWNYGYLIQTYICHLRTPLFVWQHVCLPFRVLSMFYNFPSRSLCFQTCFIASMMFS